MGRTKYHCSCKNGYVFSVKTQYTQKTNQTFQIQASSVLTEQSSNTRSRSGTLNLLRYHDQSNSGANIGSDYIDRGNVSMDWNNGYKKGNMMVLLDSNREHGLWVFWSSNISGWTALIIGRWIYLCIIGFPLNR